MKKKLTPQSYTDEPAAGVGILSGFGAPENPPDYNLDRDNKKRVVPNVDTHPGTGLNHLDDRPNNPIAESLLGEDE